MKKSNKKLYWGDEAAHLKKQGRSKGLFDVAAVLDPILQIIVLHRSSEVILWKRVIRDCIEEMKLPP